MKYRKPNQEQIDMLALLLQTAKVGKHTIPEFICNIKEAEVALVFYKAMYKLVRGLKRAAKAVFSDYLKTIEKGTNTLDQLLSYNEILDCLAFYKEEKAIAYDMLDEYYHYVMSGHIIDTFLNCPRAESDLRDFREEE